ncbi:MAG: phosphatidylglycerophosphatase A family protein [Candidatus Binatia bacterium]
MRNITLIVATGAGIGHVPRCPGTLGTCLGIPCSLALNQLASDTLYGGVLVLIGFTAFAIWLSGKAAAFLVLKDPQVIVIDEIAGFLIANFSNQQKLSSVALAFILFRFFDIVKLFPASKAEELPGGFGIVLDDVVAGIYTFAILYMLPRWIFV